jgi:hypothetical protein
MMSNPLRSWLAIAGIVACCGAAVWAQQPPAKAPAQDADAEEEAFDNKIREFGFWSGAAFSCVGEARQAEVERKVLDNFNGIARLFGTDRAFFYAAAFGNGTTHKVDPAKCPEFLDKFQKAAATSGGKK